jgi:hypothetical protein
VVVVVKMQASSLVAIFGVHKEGRKNLGGVQLAAALAAHINIIYHHYLRSTRGSLVVFALVRPCDTYTYHGCRGDTIYLVSSKL